MIKYFCDRCGKEIKGKVHEITDTTEAIDPHRKEVVATWKSVEYICDECQQADLTCGFKIGDTVITSTGKVGRITDICTCERCKERGFYEPTVEVQIGIGSIQITDNDKRCNFASFYKIGDHIYGNLDEEIVLDEIEFAKDQIKTLENSLTELNTQLNVVRAMKHN